MKMINRFSKNQWYTLTLVVVMVAVTISGLVYLPGPAERISAAVLLGLFAIILFSPFFWEGSDLRVHIGLAILSALAAALFALRSGWYFFPILFFMLAPFAMMRLPIRAGLVWVGLFILITAIMQLAYDGLVGLALMLPYAAGYVFFGIFGWMTLESQRERDRSDQLLAELQAAHRQLQEYAARLEDFTIAQERNRIAREMHDTLGHRLTIASVQLEGAQRLIPTNQERAAAMVETVREQVKEGLTDLRRTVAMLRAPVEEDLPLAKAITRLVEQVQQVTAITIHLSLAGCPANLPVPQHQALYRAAQEALTNIQRHAQASEAWLQLTTRDGMVELLVSDNGVGMAQGQAQPGFGLVGLQERAALQGGSFYADQRPGGGTQITFRLPLYLANGGEHE